MTDTVRRRRELHMIPELGKQLPETLAYIENELRAMGLEFDHPAESTVSVYFDFGCDTTVAFRADTDALPITEKNRVDYRSSHPGRMHACGHDGHTAILLTLADRLSKLGELKNNVLLIFQPAEETTGGAQDICRSGLLAWRGVSAVFGLHLWPGLEFGKLAAKPGPLMARSREVTVHINGRSAHVARAADAADAVYAGGVFLAELYEAAEGMDGIIRFGLFEGGEARNAIAGSAQLLGTVRSFSETDDRRYAELISDSALAAEKKTGTAIEVELSEGYPPVINDAALTEKAAQILGERLSLDAVAALTAEDFSFYGAAAPSVFFFLGVGDAAPLHSAQFDFDDKVLDGGVEAFLCLANGSY